MQGTKKTKENLYLIIDLDLMEEKERPSFEEALKELESIVKKLENDEITLEDSVKLYEKGLELSKFCSEILDQAELRIEQINEA
ncbi:MAG: exodeoxyribonuclease VII small subunit [Balneolaceae bacterium]